MAILLRELALRIEESCALALGVELFAGHIPSKQPIVNDTVVLLEAGGTPALPRLRGNVGEYGFDVLAIARFSADAHAMARTIFDVFADLPGANLGEWEACVIEAVNEPQFTGFDEHQRFQVFSSYTLRGYHRASWWAV